ncbi:LysR family transcriptional regulator [Croceicoccus sp. F390]|uniref:LysR family transcriptional regulator n=1 Tax=Croceicoccus esteveae TaxID=3075597 RepID=A0ABU2ZDU2_9SPHN|nr:LysR family transcriptional regulator [Croceicoccus sp. F390]MDT0574775.1 LysR family transcriptional regulator [Croceicoccus sp. F390]
MRRLPPLRSLEAFIRIVRLGSAKAAAAELALSPSALSRRVSALEDHIAKKLFLRQHQAMKLTEDGQALFDAVAPVLDELVEQLEAQTGDNRLLRLRLAVMPLFGEQRLVPRLAELRRLHPTLHIDMDSSANPVPKLGDTLDAAIILSMEPDPSLHCVQLDQNFVHAITSRALADELGAEPKTDLLARQNFFVHSGMEGSFEAWRESVGLTTKYRPIVDHYDSGALMLEAAAQGLGIAIMHADHLARSGDDRLSPLYPQIKVASPYSYWFVCRPRALENRPVRMFMNWLMAAQL